MVCTLDHIGLEDPSSFGIAQTKALVRAIKNVGAVLDGGELVVLLGSEMSIGLSRGEVVV